MPKAGSYNLECIAAITNSGEFALFDPDGNQVGAGLIIPVSGNKTFTIGCITFNLADGAADFILGDKFDIPVVANGKVVPFAIAGVCGAQNPSLVANFDIEALGAGDITTRLIKQGQVREQNLIIDLDGTGVNITQEHLDALQVEGISATNVEELNILDNQ